jgi:hypothetical protein
MVVDVDVDVVVGVVEAECLPSQWDKWAATVDAEQSGRRKGNEERGDCLGRRSGGERGRRRRAGAIARDGKRDRDRQAPTGRRRESSSIRPTSPTNMRQACPVSSCRRARQR